jgi:hypothetical protein
MAWQNPKLDWKTNPHNPLPDDFNRIEGNIDFLKQDIETKKGLIVDAINDMNQPATIADTHAQLANKIRDISKDADAAVANVLSGKTFYQGGEKKTGTMVNHGSLSYDPDIVQKTKSAGYISGLIIHPLQIEVGDNVLWQDLSTRETKSQTFVSLHGSFVTNYDGVLRVKHRLGLGTETYPVFSQIFVNNVAVGILREQTDDYVNYTEDISVSAGDIIELRARKTTIGYTARISNFKLLGRLKQWLEKVEV